MAPVLPADTKPWDRPSATVRAPTTIDESGMFFTADAGSLSRGDDRRARHYLDVGAVGPGQQRLDHLGPPTSSTRNVGDATISAPATISSGAWSPPSASSVSVTGASPVARGSGVSRPYSLFAHGRSLPPIMCSAGHLRRPSRRLSHKERVTGSGIDCTLGHAPAPAPIGATPPSDRGAGAPRHPNTDFTRATVPFLHARSAIANSRPRDTSGPRGTTTDGGSSEKKFEPATGGLALRTFVRYNSGAGRIGVPY